MRPVCRGEPVNPIGASLAALLNSGFAAGRASFPLQAKGRGLIPQQALSEDAIAFPITDDTR
jgi:hypothetical protein